MSEYTDFKTFLSISSNKLAIYLIETKNHSVLFEKEVDIENNNKKFDTNNLDKFLKENIFNIEKLVKQFVKNIYLIIDIKDLFPVKISIKKNNYGNLITFDSLKYPLNEIKDQCHKTLKNEKIIHMIIDNYQIDKKDFKFLPKNLNCNDFSLDVTFICLSNKKVKNLEKIFNKYHISIKKIISAKYVREYLGGEDIDVFDKTLKIIDGFNENEVIFVEKSSKNKGFFEKFFDFFS